MMFTWLELPLPVYFLHCAFQKGSLSYKSAIYLGGEIDCIFLIFNSQLWLLLLLNNKCALSRFMIFGFVFSNTDQFSCFLHIYNFLQVPNSWVVLGLPNRALIDYRLDHLINITFSLLLPILLTTKTK